MHRQVGRMIGCRAQAATPPGTVPGVLGRHDVQTGPSTRCHAQHSTEPRACHAQ